MNTQKSVTDLFNEVVKKAEGMKIEFLYEGYHLPDILDGGMHLKGTEDAATVKDRLEDLKDDLQSVLEDVIDHLYTLERARETIDELCKTTLQMTALLTAEEGGHMKRKKRLPRGTYCDLKELHTGEPAVLFLPSGKTIRTEPVIRCFIAPEGFTIETEKRIYTK